MRKGGSVFSAGGVQKASCTDKNAALRTLPAACRNFLLMIRSKCAIIKVIEKREA